MQRVMKTVALGLAVALLSACANNPHQRAMIGAGTGAVLGGVVGHQLDDKNGRYVGAAVGALAGGAVGHYMDQQQAELDRALANERQQGLQIQRMDDGSIKLDIPSEISFDYDSARIKPAFVSPLERVSGVLSNYPDTTISIVGHTDSTGSDNYNYDLSRRRAESVASFLSTRGVERSRMRTEGRGETQPRSSNATEEGRRQNRRVEMFIRPNSNAGQSGGGYQQQGGYNSGYPQQQGGGYGGGYPQQQGGYGGGYPQQSGGYGYPQQGGYGQPNGGAF